MTPAAAKNTSEAGARKRPRLAVSPPTRAALARAQYALLVATAVALPLLRRAFPVLMAALLLCWLANIIVNDKKPRPQGNRAVAVAAPFAALYAVYAAGMLYSQNTQYGAADLLLKLPLLLLPPALATMAAADTWTEGQRRGALLAFALACAALCLAYKGYGIWQTANKGVSLRHFSYVGYNRPGPMQFHTTYITMYYSLAAGILTLRLMRFGEPRRWLTATMAAAAALLVADVALISSRAGMASTLAALIFCAAWGALRRWPRRGLLYPLAGLAIFAATCNLMPKKMNRGATFAASVERSLADEKAAPTDESLGERLVAWRNSAAVARGSFPWGVGTGDIRDALQREHQQHPDSRGFLRYLNSHNQYLQTLCAVGVPGLLPLLAALAAGLWLGWRRRYAPLVLFSGIVALNCMSESILERQDGVQFVAFFGAALALLASLPHDEALADT